jgi:hypothetical protein
MAVCTANRVIKFKFKIFKKKTIVLFDDAGNKKDKFPTKPSDLG